MSSRKSGSRSFFGHPRGLAYLAFTDGWQSFSFFGVQSLLVLYLVGELLLPGHAERVIGLELLRSALQMLLGPLSTQALSSVIFGFYTSVTFLLPLFGGMIGDRWLGQHRAVIIGGLLIICGQLLMGLVSAAFLVSLPLMLAGSGLVKGNVSKQVGVLYGHDDRRRAEAFQIYYVCLSICVLAAPLICGTLGELYGWHFGFLASSGGMLIGLITYLAGQRHLPAEHRDSTQPLATHGQLTAPERRRVVVLVLLLIVPTCFMIGGSQLANAYVLWVRDHVARGAFGATVPVTWFQSIATIGAIVLPAFVMRFWRLQSRRGSEPGMLAKMGIGCAIAAAAYLLLAAFSHWGTGGNGVPWVWLLGFHLLQSLGYLYLWPVGMALYSRSAPQGMSATFMGVYFLAAFIAANLVGWLGSFYDTMPAPTFWLMHAAILALGAAVIAIAHRSWQRVLATSTAATGSTAG